MCLELGVLPNDPRFLALTEVEIVWLSEAARSRELERRAWIAKTLPKVIGRSLGLYWTWDDVNVHADENGLCSLCHEGHMDMVHGESGVELRCDSCGKPWAAAGVDSGRKPSEVLIGLAAVFANAMHGKRPSDIRAMAKRMLGPPVDEKNPAGSVNRSLTKPGAVMMDSHHSDKRTFLDIIQQADAEEAARREAEKASEVKNKADALFASFKGV